jgi:hypothetical protein
VTIERGIMTREIMLRMMKMAEMRDPRRPAVRQRVGAYAAEIYQHLARSRLDEFVLRRNRTSCAWRPCSTT